MEAHIYNPSTWEVETERSDAQKHSEARSESCMYIPLLFLPYLSISSLLFSYPLSFIPHHPSLLCFSFPCSSLLSFSSIFPLTLPSSLSRSFKSLPTSFQATGSQALPGLPLQISELVRKPGFLLLSLFQRADALQNWPVAYREGWQAHTAFTGPCVASSSSQAQTACILNRMVPF